MDVFNDWAVTKLTEGTNEGRFHSHAYYDIPVFDSGSRFIAGHQVRFTERQPTRDDAIEIGYVDTEGDGGWVPVGQSRAWSWQQGAMTQWLPNSRTIVWNDREGDRFVARTFDVESGRSGTLPRPVYAVNPAGRFALALNMARLDHVRPGYGYVGGSGALLSERRPSEDGVWKVDLETGASELLLSLQEATRFLLSRLPLRSRLRHLVRRYTYWFNHVKISPDGSRFTVKLRFRNAQSGWNDQMGVSLTCGTDGRDLRLLTDGTSHVIWLDDEHLYLWQRDGVYLYRDEKPEGRRVEHIAPDLIDHNVHMRHFPGDDERFVFDTPYRETVELFTYDARDGRREKVARFGSHTPKRGPFRCDVHPSPSPDAQKIAVTSLDDGGRQIYLLTR
jgi:hypothetical protein